MANIGDAHYYLKGETINGFEIKKDGWYNWYGIILQPAPPCKKQTYSSSLEADLALEMIQQMGRIKDKTPIRNYKCEICGHYHLTSQRKRT